MSTEDFQYLLNYTDIHSLADLIKWTSEAKKTKDLHAKYEDYFFSCSVANPKTWDKTAREIKQKITIQDIIIRKLLTEQVPEAKKDDNYIDPMRWEI